MLPSGRAPGTRREHECGLKLAPALLTQLSEAVAVRNRKEGPGPL